MKNVQISFDEALLDEVDRFASSSQVSRSEVVRQALRKWLKAQEIRRFANLWDPQDSITPTHLKAFPLSTCPGGDRAYFHPPSQEDTVSRPWRNAGVLQGLAEGGLELRRVTPQRRCHGLLPGGLHGKKSRDVLLDLGLESAM